jgi:hypothetical protein
VPEFLPEVMPAVEIGSRLARPFWGRGLATEAARAPLCFGLTDRGLERIMSIAQVVNHASSPRQYRMTEVVASPKHHQNLWID